MRFKVFIFLTLILLSHPIFGCLETLAQTRNTLERDVFNSIVKVRALVPAQARTAKSLGEAREASGVIIDGNGLVLSIGYAILEANKVLVEMHNGVKYPASIIGYDHGTGFGLLRIAPPKDIKPITLGDSDQLTPKQMLMVSGFGGKSAAIAAMLVDIKEFAGYWEYLLEGALFTSPPYRNFAGAALIDPSGNLVGIGSLVVPNALQQDGQSFPGNMFIPINLLKPILADLIAEGKSNKFRRPWLGISAQEFEGRVFVINVSENGPGWKAGIRKGDLLLGVGESRLSGLRDYYKKIWALGKPGVEVPLVLLRGNQITRLMVKSMDRFDWFKLRNVNPSDDK